MKLWQTSPSLLQNIEAFTIGKDRELDLLLARYDILGSIAHIHMLEEVGLLEAKELEQLVGALSAIYKSATKGDFKIEAGIEDVHSQVELLLTRQLGDIGKKIHTGRSRNDQVLVDLRLFFREEIKFITEETVRTFDTLIDLAGKFEKYLMPGYTHLQVGMVSSVGMWLSAFAESLTDDLRLMQSVYKINNQKPAWVSGGIWFFLPAKAPNYN